MAIRDISERAQVIQSGKEKAVLEIAGCPDGFDVRWQEVSCFEGLESIRFLKVA